MPVGVGDVLAGKYRLERRLGEGGMGVVWGARHVELDERFAIKLLHPNMLENVEAATRFTREAKAAVRIKNEHVARVTDVGTTDAGVPYMVMEYLDGKDLAQVVQARKLLPVGDAVEIVLQASEAIAEAHSLGIIHRDLKPANLFLTRRSDGTPCVKVLDFGISKLSNPEHGLAADVTHTHVHLGSPGYMSPEHMRSTRDVDARTDIWALGVILYELLTGAPPFEADSLPHLCAKILQDEPVRPCALRPDLPPGLEAVILLCLRKSREERFRSVTDLAMTLAPFAPHRVRQATLDSWSRIRVASTPDSRDGDTLAAKGWSTPSGAPGAPLPASTTASQRPSRGSLAVLGVGVGLGIAIAVVALGVQRAAGTASPRPAGQVELAPPPAEPLATAAATAPAPAAVPVPSPVASSPPVSASSATAPAPAPLPLAAPPRRPTKKAGPPAEAAAIPAPTPERQPERTLGERY